MTTAQSLQMTTARSLQMTTAQSLQMATARSLQMTTARSLQTQIFAHFLRFQANLRLLLHPDGRPGMSDVYPSPVRNLRAVI